jgi:anti-sigma regulatory factor (Ser/Thr protein kinase)
MEDLSLHILDIAENATNAGATLVEIFIREDTGKNLLEIVIRDNGSGINQEMLERVRDPFVTTRKTRRLGLGLPLLEQATREAGGNLTIASEPDRGTEVTATFRANHIDRKPLGDMGSTMISLIVGSPEVDFVYESDLDGEKTRLDTREIRAEMGSATPINDPALLQLIRNLFKKDQQN